jgi:nucleoid-associated protein YgaU
LLAGKGSTTVVPQPEPLRPAVSELPTASRGADYRVQRGDTLWGIAANRYGANRAPVMVKQILALNSSQIRDVDMLREGQVIKLP